MHGVNTINVFFDDKDFDKLKKIKKHRQSWHDFILTLTKKEKGKKTPKKTEH